MNNKTLMDISVSSSELPYEWYLTVQKLIAEIARLKYPFIGKTNDEHDSNNKDDRKKDS